MSIASEIQQLQSNLSDSYTACQNKGATIPQDQNFDNLSTCIDSIPAGGGGGVGILREVVNGVYQMPTTSFSFSLPNNATNVGDYAVYSAFRGCISLTSMDLSSLTTVSGNSAFAYVCYGCTGLTSIDLSNLATISNNEYAFSSAFYGCTSLINVDLSSLTTISGTEGLQNTFQGCTSLTSIDLSSLTDASIRNALYGTFRDCTSLTSIDLSNLTNAGNAYYPLANICYGCRNLTNVDLSSLTNISGYQAMSNAFRGCTSLTTLSFPALTSNSFTGYTNQFYNMLQGVTGCTVHFPSNLQSVIGNWTDVINGFGGTNTTVLFDLPATT